MQGGEQDFSKLEGWFCNKVYDPFLANGSVAVNYSKELGLFVASVGFRYIHLTLRIKPEQTCGTSVWQDVRKLADELF